MLTNKDVYDRVAGFEDKFKGQCTPSLEEYLRSLWLLVSREQHGTPMVEEVLDWLERSFTTAPPDFDPEWLKITIEDCMFGGELGYEHWEKEILFSIADLHQMAEDGTLDRADCGGTTGVSGLTWYNLDPFSFLECGVYASMYHEEIYSIQPISELSWAEFTGILSYGRSYE